MRKPPIYLLIALMAMSCLLIPTTGCFKDGTTAKLVHYTIYNPIYGSKAAALAGINGVAGKKIGSVGKIYVSGSHIFISEPEKGIHVIDNSNPINPRETAFLSIPGNQDIAIKGNTLYADMYTDLLAIDISDLHKAKVTGTIEGMFSNRKYVHGYSAMRTGETIIDWQIKDTVAIQRMGVIDPGGVCPNCGIMYFNAPAANFQNQAGSMAKMVLTKDHLFAITQWDTLAIVNLDEPSSPAIGSKVKAGINLETIYPFEDKLFLGSATGLYIYDISNPGAPVNAGIFSHARSCDPVVTDGKYAYVTLRAGGHCGEASNELDVVNVEELMHPQLVKTYPMSSPGGLSKDGDLLFVCDGDGVKVFNTSDPAGLRLQQKAGSGLAYDVIAGNKLVLIVSDKGLYQYSYDHDGKMQQLSLFAAGGK